MAASEHVHDDIWRTPIPASTTPEDEQIDRSTLSRTVEEHSVEDAWYQVLRRKHVEEADDE